MKSYYKTGLLGLMLCMTLISCNKKSVTRVDPSQQIDLSGRWNDTDSRLVAEEMISDAMNRRWLANFQAKHNRQPIIIVGLISNKSSEHIASETFIRDMERQFVNSGVIRIVQNSVFREKLREERADQQEFASPESQKRWGRELGADFMIFGTINSIIDKEGKRQVRFYQINLDLTDIETNEMVWVGDKKIKKYVVN
jgi:penicillin-binding protein activator